MLVKLKLKDVKVPYSDLSTISNNGKPSTNKLDRAEELEKKGISNYRIYATDLEPKAAEEADKAAAKQALLDKLGITAEEAQLLLGGN